MPRTPRSRYTNPFTLSPNSFILYVMSKPKRNSPVATLTPVLINPFYNPPQVQRRWSKNKYISPKTRYVPPPPPRLFRPAYKSSPKKFRHAPLPPPRVSRGQNYAAGKRRK